MHICMLIKTQVIHYEGIQVHTHMVNSYTTMQLTAVTVLVHPRVLPPSFPADRDPQEHVGDPPCKMSALF